MGACLGAQRGACTECTVSAQSRSRANPHPLTLHQKTLVGGSIEDTSPIQDVPRATTAAAEPVTLLPGTTFDTTMSGLADAVSAAATCHPAELPDQLETSDEIEETQSRSPSAAGNQPHDSASSTPRASMDYTSGTLPAEADITDAATPVDANVAPTATATITSIPAHNTKGFMPDTAAAAKLCRRLRQERKAKTVAERALAVSALVAANLARQLSAEQDLRSAAEGAARDKSAALTAAQQLAADLARQLIIEQAEHAEQKGTLCTKLAAAEQRAADMACQASSEQEARVAAQQAQAAAAAAADGLKWDLAATRLRIANLERDIGAEQASKQTSEELLQATLQQALVVEQRVSELEAALQQTQQQAAHAIAEAQAKCLASLRPPAFPKEALVGTPRPLGSGTFGDVWAQGLDLAFKTASTKGDLAENWRCLAEEARLMSECRHDNILPLVGVIQGDNGNVMAIAMPRGDHDLHDELVKRGRATGCLALQAQRVKEIGLGLTSALHYLHNNAGIVHHDVKLGNIVIMADGVPKVADFGLGLRIQAGDFGCHWQQCSAGLGRARGTPLESIHPYTMLCRWMPGPHDDVWALCMSLQVCVSGRPLTQEQRADLDRRLHTDHAGLAEVDAVCSSFGLTEPSMDQRLAALQLIWPLQIQPREPGMEDLVQVLQLVLAPGLDRAYDPPADILCALHNTLMQIPDCPAHPAP